VTGATDWGHPWPWRPRQSIGSRSIAVWHTHQVIQSQSSSEDRGDWNIARHNHMCSWCPTAEDGRASALFSLSLFLWADLLVDCMNGRLHSANGPRADFGGLPRMNNQNQCKLTRPTKWPPMRVVSR